MDLFVALPDLEYVCGLDICEALVKVNRKLGFKNFNLSVRVSKRHDGEKDQTWDQEYIERKLNKYQGSIMRVWVNGPPLMNESFDRAFEVLSKKLGLESS